MIPRSKQSLLLAALLTIAFLAFHTPGAAAQQVTYYTFDAPNSTNPASSSYSCSTTNPTANPPFCFNGSAGDPSFILDPANGTSYAAQLTSAAGSQNASMWFSVPQVVAGGFNTWFAFKITPVSPDITSTADGFAFVIQNAQGGMTDAVSGCYENAPVSGNAGPIPTGPTTVGSGGGCMGYGGIDNSIALEFDTFWNSQWDPYQATGGYTYQDNHISLQSCGPGVANSPAHYVSESAPGCEVFLPGSDSSIPTLITSPETSAAPPTASTGVTLADGNVHQVVIVYNGPNDNPANTIYVYLDPVFNPGTVTPVTGSVPLFSGPYNITQAMNLLNSATGTDSAYVGFTSGTGEDYEQHEIMGWTFTPHTPVTQSQPLQPDGSPTYQPFPFGTHTYAVQYPANAQSTSGISMTVTANTVTPTLFSQLIAGTPYQGSACQVYDDTGGNCVIYSVSCSVTATGAPIACPAATVSDCIGSDAASCINVKTTYNSIQTPSSPGFLQGDPFFTAISSITGSGSSATITCTGECSVTPNQTVTVLGAQSSAFDGSYTVVASSASNVFTATSTFSSSLTGSTTGGYLTSNNVQNIFVSWVPQNIDGTSTGRTTNFSDFVFTSVTNNAVTQMQLGAASTTPTLGLPDLLTATLTGSAAQIAAPTGNVAFYAGPTLLCTTPVATVATVTTATCSYTPAVPGPVSITAQYVGDSVHLPANAGPLTLNPVAPLTININPSSIDFGTLYLGSIVTKIVTITNTGTGAVTIHDPLIAIVQGGNSSEFVTLNLCPKSLAVSKSCYMTVTFIAGPWYTPQTATLTINDNAYGGPHSVPLTATVINPIAHFSTNSLSFGKVKTGTSSASQSVTLTNTGATTLSIGSITLAGANPGDFQASTCPATLAPKAACSISVTFKPSVKAARSAVLVVTDNAQNSPQSISLSGTGS